MKRSSSPGVGIQAEIVDRRSQLLPSRRSLAAATAVLAACVSAILLLPERDAHIMGRVIVIDGDTVEVRGVRVRISGIDAPERRQTCRDMDHRSWRCGVVAAAALDEYLVGSRPLRCRLLERDRYGRFVGDCFRADGKNVAVWLVTSGHALDWPRYSDGAYAAHQEQAQTAKSGIWSGTFECLGTGAQTGGSFATAAVACDRTCPVPVGISTIKSRCSLADARSVCVNA